MFATAANASMAARTRVGMVNHPPTSALMTSALEAITPKINDSTMVAPLHFTRAPQSRARRLPGLLVGAHVMTHARAPVRCSSGVRADRSLL